MLADNILKGMMKEFLLYSKKMGWEQEDLKCLSALFFKRVKEYDDVKKNTDRNNTTYWIGKKFFENLTGDSDNKNCGAHREFDFLISGRYLITNLIAIESILKDYSIKE